GRVGHEFGATTGRARRCGWLDLVALKYAVEVNGVTQLMMMKGDVLSGFDELNVCTAYEYRGESITHLPYSLNPEELTPQYTTLPGWKEDLTGMRNERDLPKTFNEYIAFIETFVEVPIRIVSVGPDRSQTIFRSIE
ncbi:MAG: adenylosuccinate synthetase, partial [Flavobacteriaceae bacterium]